MGKRAEITATAGASIHELICRQKQSIRRKRTLTPPGRRQHTMAKIEKIWVESESGEPEYIRKVTPEIRSTSLNGSSTVDGLAHYETADGKMCNREGNTFIVVSTGRRLTMR